MICRRILVYRNMSDSKIKVILLFSVYLIVPLLSITIYNTSVTFPHNSLNVSSV